MNNDLISRSALKEAMEELFDNGGYDSGLVMNTIDNAPTVEQECYITGAQWNEFMKEHKRPHGEWIFGSTLGHGWMKCSNCCVSQSGQTFCWSYCPNCGADMGEEKKDDN